MSTLRINRIELGDGSKGVATDYVVDGLAKARCHMVTGTFTINSSLNISSTVDNGTGDFTENFTNAFLNAFYTLSGTAQSSGYVTYDYALTYQLAPSARINTRAVSTNALADFISPQTVIHGELA